MGFAGVDPRSSLVVFDPGAPAFKSSKLKELLGSVIHVLHNLGPYCAAVAAAEGMAWLTEGGLEGDRPYGYAGGPKHAARPAGWGPGRAELARGQAPMDVEGGGRYGSSEFSWGGETLCCCVRAAAPRDCSGARTWSERRC